MRDVVWTIIVLWLIWKLLEAFKFISKPQQNSANSQNNNQFYSNFNKKEGEVKVDIKGEKPKSHFKPTDGEYVDYEEIKD